MLHTLADPNRLVALHGRHKPDRDLVIALVEARLIELPPNSLRRRVLEQMIERQRALPSSR